MIRTGNLRKQVMISLPIEQPDTFGVPSGSTTPQYFPPVSSFAPWPIPLPDGEPTSSNSWGPFWAEVKPLKGTEKYVAEQLRGEVSHSVRMRYIGSIVRLTPRHVILYQSRDGVIQLNINQVINVDERYVEYLLLCTQVTTPQ